MLWMAWKSHDFSKKHTQTSCIYECIIFKHCNSVNDFVQVICHSRCIVERVSNGKKLIHRALNRFIVWSFSFRFIPIILMTTFVQILQNFCLSGYSLSTVNVNRNQCLKKDWEGGTAGARMSVEQGLSQLLQPCVSLPDYSQLWEFCSAKNQNSSQASVLCDLLHVVCCSHHQHHWDVSVDCPQHSLKK